jgi:hypothetical protein
MKQIQGFNNYFITKSGKVYSMNIDDFISIYSHLGYERVSLCKNNKLSQKLVHRLIAEAYIPNNNNKPFVNHINGIKNDNRVENLEWVTSSENIKHAHITGLYKSNFNPGEMGKKTIKYAQVANCKIVLDTQYGIFYDSVKEAEQLTGIKYLYPKLKGVNENKTNLIYA